VTIYNGNEVWDLFEKNLAQAQKKLSGITVYCGQEIVVSGLSGWVYEQTVQHCLMRELKKLGIRTKIQEQLTLVRRTKADLVINNVALEIKSAGLFGEDMRRYRECQKCAKARGLRYVFVTSAESVKKYRSEIVKTLEPENVFFLDAAEDWGRLIGIFSSRRK
jgi:hypothetical protein